MAPPKRRQPRGHSGKPGNPGTLGNPGNPGNSGSPGKQRSGSHSEAANHRRRKQAGRKPSDANIEKLIARMDSCPDAESLNDRVITPFVSALETVCRARGYMLNIYGENTNLTVGAEQDVETIYHLIEEYLDSEEAIKKATKKFE